MQTHEDRDFYERLEQRAAEAVKHDMSRITGGMSGEPELAAWESHGIHAIQRPNDEQGILRISIGGGVPGHDINYLVFRGPADLCESLMLRALQAIRARPRE